MIADGYRYAGASLLADTAGMEPWSSITDGFRTGQVTVPDMINGLLPIKALLSGNYEAVGGWTTSLVGGGIAAKAMSGSGALRYMNTHGFSYNAIDDVARSAGHFRSQVGAVGVWSYGEVPGKFSSGIFEETGSGSVFYRSVDSTRRPVGIEASITQDMIKTGTPANPSITPPGWAGNGSLHNQARGHLLGNQLGGSGDLVENLVTLQQNWTNSPVMRGFESQVRSAVEGGQVVQYSATPIYNGNNLIPRGVTLIGNGNNGFSLGVTVLNPIGF